MLGIYSYRDTPCPFGLQFLTTTAEVNTRKESRYYTRYVYSLSFFSPLSSLSEPLITPLQLKIFPATLQNPSLVRRMSTLQYYAYPGVGATNKREYSYSQAVRVGDIVKCSGQGGWDDNGSIDANDLPGQVAKAFQNVEKNLQDAGLRGWEDVYSVRSYHISLEQSFDLIVEQFRKAMPNHQPIWSCVGSGNWDFRE